MDEMGQGLCVLQAALCLFFQGWRGEKKKKKSRQPQPAASPTDGPSAGFISALLAEILPVIPGRHLAGSQAREFGVQNLSGHRGAQHSPSL